LGWKKLYKAIYGIIFFAVPHKGLLTTDILKIIEQQKHGRSHPRRKLLRSIELGSEALEGQMKAFTSMVQHRKIVTFHELLETPTLEWVRSRSVFPTLFSSQRYDRKLILIHRIGSRIVSNEVVIPLHKFKKALHFCISSMRKLLTACTQTTLPSSSSKPMLNRDIGTRCSGCTTSWRMGIMSYITCKGVTGTCLQISRAGEY
jgi:hypothetical protein